MLDVEEQLRRYGDAVEEWLRTTSADAPIPTAHRRHRWVRPLVVAAVVLALLSAGLVIRSSGTSKHAVTTTPRSPGVFATPTGSVLLFSDGGTGAIAVDLDSKLVMRHPLDGERPGDQPFRISSAGADLVFGWGEIYAAPVAEGPSRKIADATIYIPAAEPDEIWTFDWSGGRIGQGDLTVRRLRTDGTVVFESRAFDDQLFSPLLGVPGGLLVQAPQGVRIWDADSQSVGPLLGPGRATAASSDGHTVTWCEAQCQVSHSADLAQTGSPTPANAVLGDAIALSPDGTHLAYVRTSGDSTTLVVLDLHAGTRVEQPVTAHDSPRLLWTADGQQLFYVNDSWQQPQTTIGRFDVASGEWEVHTIDMGGLLAPIVLSSAQAQSPTGGSADVPPCPPGIVGPTETLEACRLGLSTAQPAGDAATNAPLIALARAAGFGSAKDPLSAYLASCLTAKGYPATYDDAVGTVTFDGDPDLMNTCLTELEARKTSD